MKIVLAIDSFKGSLTSHEAEQVAAEAIRHYLPSATTISIPIADGGEGTLPILLTYLKGNCQSIQAHNPCMELIQTHYGISGNGRTAIIEMAAISGLPLIREEQKNPMKTTSFGTGELIRDALEKGCTEFIIALGGSATNDAATGILQALGYRFLDKNDQPLGYGGEILSKIANIDDSQRHPLLKNAHFIAICDVNNPFYGPEGAAYTFARQKGADDAMTEVLDKGMQAFSRQILQVTRKDISHLPGSGAAGGIGGSLAAFLDAELKSGADVLLNLSGFQEQIADANLIITGEGRIDRQSLMGKITGRILQAGLNQNIPVAAIAGSIQDKNLLKEAGFAHVIAAKPEDMPLEEAMKKKTAIRNMRAATLLAIQKMTKESEESR